MAEDQAARRPAVALRGRSWLSTQHPSVVAIYGPTGSGKTEVAVRVAAALGTEVVNCDPAQAYRGLPLLTNQPTPEHDAIAPHRVVGVWEPTVQASFVAFSELAQRAIDDLISSCSVAVACGGSGLYLQAALTNLPDPATGGAPDHDPEVRAELELRWSRGEASQLHAELGALDARVAERTHPNDRPRVIRALEVARRGGSIAPRGASHWDAPARHATLLVGLQVERSVIRARIDARTRRMFASGLLDEVAALGGSYGERADESWSATARKLHGLEDCLGVLRGDWSLQAACERMATRTRQYAKRQDTWARRWPGLVQVDATDGDVDGVAHDVLDLVARYDA